MADGGGRTRARTRTGAQAAAREEAGLPKSMAALRLTCIATIKRYRMLESDCWAAQRASGAKPEDPYAIVDEGGEKLSYAAYRRALAEKEKRLRDDVPAALWRESVKAAEAQLAAESG